MSVLRIPCPKCNSELKLRDPRLLGKKGKCPKCRHAFLLQMPELEQEEEVQFELADAAPAAPQAQAQVPVGTGARWVPDQPATATAEQPAAAPTSATPDAIPDFSSETTATPSGGVGRLKEIRRKNAKRRKITAISSSVVAVLLFGSWYGYSEWKKNQPQDDDGAPGVNAEYQEEKQRLRDASEIAKEFSPTSGKPIRLLYMPAGSRVIVNLRAAELWGADIKSQEVVACLGPVGGWLATQIKEIALYEPAEIEQITFCLALGGRGIEPQMSAVVQMVNPVKKSEWLEKSASIRNDDYGMPVYLNETRAYILSDDMKTFGVGPADLVSEMVDSANFPAPTGADIEEILKSTDSDRLATVIFNPSQVRMNLEELFAENVHDIANLVLDWFGDDVQAVSWSLHFDEYFFSQFVLLPSNVSNPDRLQKTVKSDIDQLPVEMFQAVQKMSPATIGQQTIIGRFPAMLQAVKSTTRASIDGQFVELTTVLPERATPNLAIASLMAWDESTRTDFSIEIDNTPNQGPTTVLSIAERLEIPVEFDFRRTPLQEAFQYIADETKINIVIDGDALKLAGYTKNMPQTFTIGKKTAREGILKILSEYDKMCIVVDEKAKTATVMTFAVAEGKGLKPTLPPGK